MTFNIYKVGITALTILLLNACGGGGGDTTPDDNKTDDNKSEPVIETKVKLCSKGFTVLKKGATITSLKNDTKLTIRHKQDGTREACIDSGETKIN